jgi:ABC-type phosphate/phosphonate transport system substrate-binding protein
MSDNDPILLGRAMPDDLSKKISEALNKKSITPEQELQDALDEMARDIAMIEPDPVDW